MSATVERWHEHTSGSCAGTHFGCPPSGGAFPRAHTSGQAAERGNVIHEYCRRMSLINDAELDVEQYEALRKEALDSVAVEYRYTCAGIKFGEVLQGLKVVSAEPAFAVNVKTRTARLIGLNIGRDYNGVLARDGQPLLQPYEIPLSIDIVARADTGVLVELDWKSGRHLGSPEENWQRRLSAIALMFYYGEDEANSRVGYIWEDGRVQHDGCEFTVMDAAGFCDEAVLGLDRVRKAMDEIAAGKIPAVYPSDDGCKYCASFAFCPYWTNFAKNIAGVVAGFPKVEDLATTDLAVIGEAMEVMRKAEKVFEVLGKGIKGIAAHTPIPIDKNNEYRGAEMSKVSFDAGSARGLLITLGATEEQMARLYRTNTYQDFRKRKRLPIAPPAACEPEPDPSEEPAS